MAANLNTEQCSATIPEAIDKGGQQSVRTPPWGCFKMAPNARIHVKFCMEGSFVGLF